MIRRERFWKLHRISDGPGGGHRSGTDGAADLHSFPLRKCCSNMSTDASLAKSMQARQTFRWIQLLGAYWTFGNLYLFRAKRYQRSTNGLHVDIGRNCSVLGHGGGCVNGWRGFRGIHFVGGNGRQTHVVDSHSWPRFAEIKLRAIIRNFVQGCLGSSEGSLTAVHRTQCPTGSFLPVNLHPGKMSRHTTSASTVPCRRFLCHTFASLYKDVISTSYSSLLATRNTTTKARGDF